MNSLTLVPHYPVSRSKLSCTQYISLHLMLHRPSNDHSHSTDPLYSPFISVLPREFDSHPLSWLWKEHRQSCTAVIETQLLNALPEHIITKLNRMYGLFTSDWIRIKDYLVCALMSNTLFLTYPPQKENPTVAHRRSYSTYDIALWEPDYLWAWLNGLLSHMWRLHLLIWWQSIHDLSIIVLQNLVQAKTI